MQNSKMFSLDDIIGDPLFESEKKDVKIFGIASSGRKVDITGYVSSESQKGFFYRVLAEYEPASKNLIYGDCGCEAYKYFGNPCKHVLKLRNVYAKNQDKFTASKT